MKTLKRISRTPLAWVGLLILLLGVAVALRFAVKAQEMPLNPIWSRAGIGATGSVQEDSSGVFAVTDTGTDIWGTNDTLQFIYLPLNGSGQITARILGMNGTNGWAKAGVMIRESLAVNSRNVMKFVSAGHGSHFEWRAVTGGETILGFGSTNNVVMPYWIRLVRNGDWIGGYHSSDGINWTLVDWEWLKGLPSQVLVGLAYNSHDEHRAASTAWFDQVSIVPAELSQILTPAAGIGDGLVAGYFNNRHLWGTPATEGIDSQIAAGLKDFLEYGEKTTEFSVRWTGELQAEFSEPYTFYVARDDGLRVWLNEHLIIDGWSGRHPDEEASAPINLVAGQRYLLRVEYYQNRGWARARLSWSSPSTPEHVIPQSQLYSLPTDVDGNGLPDLWEQHYFGHIGVDPNADHDNDKLSNLEEYQRHSDPTNPLNDGVPNEWTHGNIETWGASDGAASYSSNGVFTVSIGSTNRSEDLHYMFQAIGTNGEMVARILGVNGPAGARAGIMLRETLDQPARTVMLTATPSNGVAFPVRQAIGGVTVQNQRIKKFFPPYWLKVVRNNDWLGGYVSEDGTNWTLLDWDFAKGLAPQAFIGLGVSIQNNGQTYGSITAQYDQVHVGPADSSEILNAVEGNGDGLLASYRNDSLLYLPGITNRIEPAENYYQVHGPPFSILNPDNYGVCWSGEVQAQFTEPYTFDLQTRREDWVRVWLNDQLIIDGWRTWHPDYDVRSEPINLVAGQRYLLRVEMCDNHGEGVSILKWASPSTPEHVISQSQLYSQPVDSDGNGLPDNWEQIYFGHTGIDPNADPDGDGLSNLQEYRNHTNPSKADTDNDGIPDAWEVTHGLDPQFNDASLDYDNDGWSNLQKYLYGLNPSNPDANGDGLPDSFEAGYLGLDIINSHADITSIAAVANGAQGTNFLGNWQVDGNDIYCLDRRGGLDFNLWVTNADKYVLNLFGTQNQPNPFETRFKLLLAIDGQTLGQYILNAGYGTNGAVALVLPYLQGGQHTVRVFWDGAASYSSLRIRQVRLLAVSGSDANHNGIKDWAENMVRSESGFDSTNAVISSYTSPICLEGRDPYPVLMLMTNNSTNALSPVATSDGRWYVNVPLQASTQSVFQASYQNRSLTQTRKLQWLQVNLLTATNNLVIRLGDSLLFNAIPTNGVNGNLRVVIGTNTYTGNTTKPASYRFTTPGTYTVTGTYSPTSGSPRSGSVTVNVVQQNLPNVQPAAWTWMQRNLNLPSLAPEAVLQADSRLSCTITGTNTNGAVQLTLATAENQALSMIARLGTNGPVLDSTQISGFDEWSGGITYLKIIQVYPDGSQLVEMLMVSSPVETDVTFVLRPKISGVMFDDGTTIKTLTAADFDALGQCPVRFIRPATVHTSVCHSIWAYQGNYQIGYRH